MDTADPTVSMDKINLKMHHLWTITGLNLNVSYSYVPLAKFTVQNTPSLHNMVENPKITIHNSSFGSLNLGPGTEAVISDCYIDATLVPTWVLITANSSVVSLRNCNFRNFVSEGGPTILHGHSINSNIQIQNTTFYKHHGLYGTIFLQEGPSLKMNNTKFIDNIAFEFTYSPLTIWRNVDAMIANTTFENNFAFIGGAIWAGMHCSLQCFNTSFNENWAVQGGAIRIRENTALGLDNCTFNENQAVSSSTLSLRFWTSGITSLTLLGKFSSLYLQNFNLDALGGVIAAMLNCDITMETTYFHGNKADINGGAIDATVYVAIIANNCKFIGNNAKKQSGTINLFSNSSLVIHSSIFENNTATDAGSTITIAQNCTANIEKSLFTGNAGVLHGMIYAEENVNLTVKDTNFRKNEATYGPGICILINSSLQLENCYFFENFALEHIGAIQVYSNSYLNAVNSTFVGNTAKLQTGTVLVNINSRAIFSGCLFKRNNADQYSGNIQILDNSSVEIYSSLFSENTAIEGGALNVQRHSFVKIRNSNFTNNTAHASGAAIMLFDQGKANVSYCNFIGNRGPQSGAVHLQQQSESYMKNVIFSDSEATNSSGGAVSVYIQSNLYMKDSGFMSNKAVKFGGAIFITSKSNVELENVDFYNNYVSEYGAGIYAQTNSSVKAVECEFMQNYAVEKGAALTLSSDGSHGDFKRCFFKNNFVNMTGGAIYVMLNSSLNVDECTFLNNTALNESGGAIAIKYASNATISNSAFLNSTSLFGSTVYFFGFAQGNISQCHFEYNNGTSGTVYGSGNVSLAIEMSNITSNTAQFGGGIQVESNTSLMVLDTDISSNIADFGAGIGSYHSTVSLIRVKFTENDANYSSTSPVDNVLSEIKQDIDYISHKRGRSRRTFDELYKFNQISHKVMQHADNLLAGSYGLGGALLVNKNSSVYIKDCVFERNTAKNGGVAWFQNGVDVHINDTHFRDNKARYFGGVFSLHTGATLDIHNSNITGNSAQIMGEIAIILTDCRMIFSNSVLDSNTKGALDSILLGSSADLTVRDSAIRNYKNYGLLNVVFQCSGTGQITIIGSQFEKSNIGLVSANDRCSVNVENSTLSDNN